MKNVNKDIKHTQTELKAIDKLLKFDTTNTDLLSQKQGKLSEAISHTKDKLDTLKSAQQQAKQQLESGTLGQDKYNALQQEIVKTENELKNLAKEVANANTALTKIGDVGNTMKSVGAAMTSAGQSLTTYVTTPIIALGTAAVKTGADFDAAMSQVKAISGASGEDFNRLRDKAREMGATTKFSASEAADALKYMAMAGWKTEEMLEGIEGIMALAAASGEELGRTSDIVTDALSAFGLTAKDSGHFSDILAAASNNANTNVSLLGESFQYIATSAGAFKFSAEDTAVALGLMANAGIKGTQAGTSLKNAMVNLTKPTKAQIAAMQELGLITTEYVTKVDSGKVAKAQNSVEKATLSLQSAQAKYNAILKEQGTNSTAAITAHNNVEKAQIKVSDATKALTAAQAKYNQAVKEHGAGSKEAQAAHQKVEAAQSKLKTATLDLNTAQEKYNNVLKNSSADSPKAIAARNAVEKAEIALREAQEKLTKAQQGTTKAMAGQNLLMADADGNVRSLDSIIRILRSALGETNVELVDSEGNLKDFDTVLKEAADHGADLTKIQKLQAAATIFGKQNMSGMLALVNASQKDYDKLSNAVKNCTYNYDAMVNALKENQGAFTDWLKLGGSSGFDSVDEQFKQLSQKITTYIKEANGDTEQAYAHLMSDIQNQTGAFCGLTEEQARLAVNIVKGEMDKFHGTAKDTAQTMQDNLKGQLTILKSALQELAIQISDAITPTLRGIVEKVQAFVEKLQKMDDATRNSIIKWGLFAAAIGPVLLILGKVISIFGSVFTSISNLGKGVLNLISQAELGVGVGGKIASVLSTLASGPVAIAIAAIAALAAGFIYLWNTNEDFREKVIAIWDSVKTAFASLYDAIASMLEALKPVFEAAVAVIKIVWEEFCNFLCPILEGAFSIIAAALETAVGVLSGILKVFTGIFTLDWSTFWDGIKTIFGSIWNGIGDVLSAVFDTLKGVVQVFLSWFASIWEAAWTGIKAVFEMIWNMISSIFILAWEGLKAVVVTTLDIITAIISGAWEGVKTVFSTVWEGIKTAFCAVWDSIRDYVQVALLAIGSLIDAGFQIIMLPFNFIWENCKDAVFEAWDKISSGISESMSLIAGVIDKAWTGIKDTLTPILEKISDGVKDHWTTVKNVVSDAVETTRSFVSEKWDAISSYVSDVCETVTTTVGEKWDAAKERVSTIVEDLKTAVGDKWDAMKERVMPIMESIGDGILAKWEAVKERTASIYDIISSSVSNAWENIKESVSSKISGMWESVKSKFTGIWETIKGIVQRIRDCFSFEWKLPKIKLPHFKIKGSFSLSPPSVPHLSIEWYKKAMDDAYILNNPTIFGAIGGKLLGGGEAGSEAVVGTDKLASIVRDAMASVIGTGGTTVIPVYIGQERIEEIVVRANQSINYRSGGR